LAVTMAASTKWGGRGIGHTGRGRREEGACIELDALGTGELHVWHARIYTHMVMDTYTLHVHVHTYWRGVTSYTGPYSRSLRIVLLPHCADYE